MQELHPSSPAAHVETRAKLRQVYECLEMFTIALIAVVLVLTFVARHSPVRGDSMEPTLSEQDVLILSDLFYTPKRGDIIIAQSKTYGYERPLVKRVIAVGGDTIDIDDANWKVYVNGELLDEPYLARGTGSMTRYYGISHLSLPMTIPEGKLFVMGDNRQDSADSRYSGIGLIDERLVLGRVLFRLFPNSTVF